MKYFFILIGFLCIFGGRCDDITGCGGFIKTDIKGFLYNKLSAHLTFLDGTINYVTEILPNGAYSVPIYDFGVYVIKIVGPSGWSIEPSNGYQLVINNHETCVDDYNFQFMGYSVNGKVSTANINHGPPGIFIDLVNGSNIIAQTTTTDGGLFTIDKVMPGSYSLHFKSETADGKSLELNDTSYNFEVKNDNVIIKDSFIIYGYPVFGDIKFYEEPVFGVEFFVFSKSISVQNLNFSKYKCLKFDKQDLNIEGYNALCKTISNSKGEFLFPLLPGGQYLIVPIYQSNISIYDISPHNFEFEISSNSIDLRSVFQITGFSVSGKINTLDGVSIPEAEIFVNGKFLAKSDLYGNFSLKGVKRGKHEISILLSGYLFNKTIIDFDPRIPVLGIFYPEKLGICGSVVIGNTKSVENVNKFQVRRKILLINESNDEILDSVYTEIQDNENRNDISKTDDNVISSFCFYAKPGQYIIKPVIDPIISSHSLAPNQIKISLKSAPVTVKFSPFRGSVSGIVKCIEHCNAGEFEVTLRPRNGNKDSVQFTQHISISNKLSNQGHFQFKDIIPGTYQIELISANSQLSLERNRWCWSKTVLTADVMDKDIDSLLFEQVGFSLPIHSTHNVNIDYFHSSNPNDAIGSKSLLKGTSKICLPKSGQYEIRITTCHKLRNDSHFIDLNHICEKQFDFNNPNCHINIEVVEFHVQVTFELVSSGSLEHVPELNSSVNAMLKFDSNLVSKDIKWNNSRGYVDFWVEPDSIVQIFVNSSQYLVTPETIDVQLSRDTFDCLTDVGQFKLEAGTFINGRVSPALQSVAIEVRQQVSSLDENDIEPIVAVAETDENGQFNIGPLNSSFKYELKLSKSGYKIVDDLTGSGNQYQFSAYKLSELVVKVVDNYTEKALPGILLSIIGDDLRKNELTNENGEYVFVGLSPGVYYLRAMMKELEFIPYGAVEIKIVEGSLEEILIKAIRTSFSLHGKVVSLNGEAEAGLIIEGNPIKDMQDSNYQVNCKTHLIRNEFATTDETGTFRIRGLQPGCNYKLLLKSANGIENNVIRSYPNDVNIKMSNEDVNNIKIYALRSMNIKEISVMVRTDQTIYQDSLQLLVFPSDNPDNVISAHKFINEGMFFQMNLPYAHKKMEYVVRLQSNLNPNMYSNISAQEHILTVEANDMKSLYKHFEFHFYPTKKSVSDSDVALTLSSSLLLPLLIIVILVVLCKRDSLNPLYLTFSKWVRTCFGNLKHYGNNTVASGSGIKSNILDATEISELNNVVAKPNSSIVFQPIKKVPFWSRPKKV